MTEFTLVTQWSLFEADISERLPLQSKDSAIITMEREQAIPGLVQEYLLAEGRIPEPLEGQNCFDCEWVETKGWRFVSEFEVTENVLSSETAELVLESINGKASIFLNGHLLGEQNSAFYPFNCNVAKQLRAGKNRLEIFLTTGLEDFSDEEALSPDQVAFATEESLGYREGRGDLRRILLRQPAFTYGWDWSPRLVTIGIPGRVYLKTCRGAELRRVTARVRELVRSDATLEVEVEAIGPHFYSSAYALLYYTIFDPNGKVVAEESRKILLRSGLNVQRFTAQIEDAELWWPQGYGGQALYRVTAAIRSCENELYDVREAAFGIRTVVLRDVDTFTVEVNGRSIFCQGGNWVPPDAIYTRPSDATYVRLLESAADSGMNMLRIWGGGNYERDIFYDTCDRLGLLIWHDFMFACSPYPDQFAWFREEVIKEARYQVRRLSNHPCIALWCGSNENSWAFQEWWQGQTERGATLYNEILPEAVSLHAPGTPYWTGSPYGGKLPNETGVGNNHLWKAAGGYLATDLNDRLDLTGHDRYRSLFISEYGMHGPCSMRTTLQYLGDDDISRNSKNWRHHTNTRRYEETLAGALEKVYALESSEISLEDYLHFGGIWQGLAAAYAFDAARLRPECSGSLIWMYNECWGEAGWGLIDYYLRKKPAWYFVRRALAPQRLILRMGDGELIVHAFCQVPPNEGLSITAGYSLLDGNEIVLGTSKQPFNTERTIMGRFSIPHDLPPGGLFYARCNDEHLLDTAMLWPGRLTGLDIPNGRPSISVLESHADHSELLLESPTFLHGVYLETEDNVTLSDNYFDLLPGEGRVVTLTGKCEIDQISIGWVHAKLAHMKLPLSQLIKGEKNAFISPSSAERVSPKS